MQRLIPDEVLLGLIKAQPAHGYELLDRFKSKADLGRIWTMSTSQLYAVLKRLEEGGLIVGQQIVVKDAPTRIEYSITNQGEAKIRTWLNEAYPSSSIHRIRVMFISKLYIANLLGMPLEDIIELQKRACRMQRQEMILERKQVHSKIEEVVLDFIIGQLDSALNWLAHCSCFFTPHTES